MVNKKQVFPKYHWLLSRESTRHAYLIKHNLVKKLFTEADDTLGLNLSKIILNGPKQELDYTENTQPAIFLVSYSIFKVIKEEFNIDLNKAKYFAGHSLGEYSALSCAGYLDFNETVNKTK